LRQDEKAAREVHRHREKKESERGALAPREGQASPGGSRREGVDDVYECSHRVIAERVNFGSAYKTERKKEQARERTQKAETEEARERVHSVHTMEVTERI
jgi:hypothetical protein